MSKFLPEKEV